jgi:hypothetical protein
MEPLKEWICDECGTVVTVDDGTVLWNRAHPGDGQLPAFHTDFVIVHNKCDKNESTRLQSLHLDELVGPKGLMRLTEMLSGGPFQQGMTYLPNPDYKSYVDLFRRLHVPYYEEARRFFFGTQTADKWFNQGQRMVLDSQDWQDFIAEAKKEIHPAIASGLL